MAAGTIMYDDQPYAGGGGGGASYTELTQQEYNALTQEQKMDGTMYLITDAPSGNVDNSIIAGAFDPTKTYAAGDYCIYQGLLYKFNTSHTGAWDALDADETTVSDEFGGESIQYSTIPTASASNVGKIVQFTGTTTSSYTNGYFYKCVFNDPDYEWEEVQVSEGGGSGVTRTISVYSAAVDTVSFTDMTGTNKTVTTDTNGAGTVSVTYISGQVITFTSSVAKNPNNLSEDYKKSIQILDDTTAVYVMPDGALYWYGWHGDTMTAYAYYYNGTTGKAPTLTMNTNSFKVKGNGSIDNQQGMVAFGQKYNLGNYDSIVTHVVSAGQYGNYLMSADDLKNGFTTLYTTYLKDVGIRTTDISNYSSNQYIVIQTNNNRETTIDFIYFRTSSETQYDEKANKTDIAPVENGTTASRAYSIGQQFYLNGSLYKATAAIAQGATFTIGTNCVAADCITDQLRREEVLLASSNGSITGDGPNKTTSEPLSNFKEFCIVFCTDINVASQTVYRAPYTFGHSCLQGAGFAGMYYDGTLLLQYSCLKRSDTQVRLGYVLRAGTYPSNAEIRLYGIR